MIQKTVFLNELLNDTKQDALFINELLNDTKCPPLIDVRSEECCHIRNFIMKSGLEKNNRVGPDKKQCRRNTY